MLYPRSPFFASLVGPPEFERHVIQRNFFEITEYYSGSITEPWTEDPRKARLYAHPGDLGQELHAVASRELAHMPQVRYRLEVEVLAIGEVTREQVRVYLSDALTIGLDDENHGPGPGLGVILVKADLGSLGPEDGEKEDHRSI